MSITATDVQAMVTHWLGCPTNGYLGSGYGSAVLDVLQTPAAGVAVDQLIAKLKTDVPVLSALPESAINVYAEQVAIDRTRLLVEVAGSLIPAEPADPSGA